MSTPRPFGSRDPARRWVRLREFGANPGGILEAAGVEHPPVPVLELAEFIGVDVRLGDQWRPGEIAKLEAPDLEHVPVVTLSPSLAMDERRWWVAHLLGHLFFDQFPIEQFVGGPSASDQYSRACAVADEWAADLVAPRWLVEPVLYSSRMTWGELAKMFNVPVVAMQSIVKRLRA